MVGSISQQCLVTEQERALLYVLLLQQTSSRDTAARASGRPMLKLHAPAVARRKQQVGDPSVSVLGWAQLGPQGISPCSPRLSPSSSEPFIYLLSSSFIVSS